jgi:hypothetical protein
MAFDCKDQNIPTCTELQKMGLCKVHVYTGRDKKQKKRCDKVIGARDLTPENRFAARFPEKKKAKQPKATVVQSEVVPEAVVYEPKIITTLEFVERVWSNREAIDIAEQLDNLEANPHQAIKNLIKNKSIRDSLKTYIESLPGDQQTPIIELYEHLSSMYVNYLLPDIPINGKELKQKIIETIHLEPIEAVSKFIINDINDTLFNALRLKANNTSIVYKTSKNSERSEAIENLGINSFESIFNNFNNLNAIAKTSSSDSIIFTGVFHPLVDSINSIWEKDILKPNTLYFKVFPIGTVLDAAGRVLYRHNTTGLQFEQFAYNELFKLVKYNITPNILPKVTTAVLSQFNRDFINNARLRADVKTKLEIQITNYTKLINTDLKANPRDPDIIPSDTKWSDVGLIITQAGGKALHTEFTGLTEDNRKKVLFQIIYTLYVFERIHFSHGDLHTNNIFIIDVPETELCYLVDDKIFKFKTTKLVKIYDFDHGTLLKESKIKVNDNFEKIKINMQSNPIRNTNNFFNKKLAETNIFNKNLDIVILCSAMSYLFPKFFNKFEMFKTETDTFFQQCFPGFNSNNPAVSGKRIGVTYTSLIADHDSELEYNRIFSNSLPNKGVSAEVLDMTWMNYFKKIKDNFSRIVKDFTNEVTNNHLWIPDTIIIPKLAMLKNGYFKSLSPEPAEAFNVRTQIVYSIDGRIV